MNIISQWLQLSGNEENANMLASLFLRWEIFTFYSLFEYKTNIWSNICSLVQEAKQQWKKLEEMSSFESARIPNNN